MPDERGSTDLPTERERCRSCDEPISVNAWKCPHCGFEPRKAGYPGIGILLGVGLSLTGIGALIGIPVIIGAVWHIYNRRDARPTDTDPK